MRIALGVAGSAGAAPVLLMHGLGYTRQGWGPLRELLARRYRVLSFDNRGIGESEIPPGPYTVEELARDAAQVLDEAGVGRAHVVGASLGGFAAQALAADRPERVDRLVLVGTLAGRAGAYPLPQGTLLLMAEAPSLAPEVALRRFVENAVAPGTDVALVDEIYAYRQAHPPDPAGWAAQAAAGVAWDARRPARAHHGADARARRHRGRRGRQPQRAAARRRDPGRTRRADRRASATCRSGSAARSSPRSVERFLG